MSGTDFTTTPNYGLLKPVPGADSDVWGSHINGNFDVLDTQLKSVSDRQVNYLPLAGGTLTGPLKIGGAANNPLTITPGATSNDAVVIGSPLNSISSNTIRFALAQTELSGQVIVNQLAQQPLIPNFAATGLQVITALPNAPTLVADSYAGIAEFRGRTSLNAFGAGGVTPMDGVLVRLSGTGISGGTSFQSAALGAIDIRAALNWNAVSRRTYIAFLTSATTTMAEKMRLNENGILLINATAAVGTQKLQVTGGAALDTLALAAALSRLVTTPAIGAGALVLDASVAGVFRVNLNANITALSLTNIVAGRVTAVQLELLGDGTARTINWGAWTLATGAPAPTSAAGRKDIYDIRSDGTNVVVWLTAQNVPA